MGKGADGKDNGGRAINGEKESQKLIGKIGNSAIIIGDFRTTRQNISKDIED